MRQKTSLKNMVSLRIFPINGSRSMEEWMRKHLKKFKSLQEKNVRLKSMSVDLSLDHWILKGIIEKSFKAL